MIKILISFQKVYTRPHDTNGCPDVLLLKFLRNNIKTDSGRFSAGCNVCHNTGPDGFPIPSFPEPLKLDFYFSPPESPNKLSLKLL